TMAADREDYLAHPRSGEAIGYRDKSLVLKINSPTAPRIQFVISDGLNANAVNENLREVLPALRKALEASGHRPSETDIVIENGRVRAGYHAGALLGADAIINFIGERPGTGLNTLSAYITYGRDQTGNLRWTSDLDHSATTAICGINAKGKPPAAAVD